MPAKSKAQQSFFGIVRALQKGEIDSSEVSDAIKKTAKSMKRADVKKYASTKRKGLPDKVSEARFVPQEVSVELEQIISRFMSYIAKELDSYGYKITLFVRDNRENLSTGDEKLLKRNLKVMKIIKKALIK